jgi:hypothetical protein
MAEEPLGSRTIAEDSIKVGEVGVRGDALAFADPGSVYWQCIFFFTQASQGVPSSLFAHCADISQGALANVKLEEHAYFYFQSSALVTRNLCSWCFGRFLGM